MPVMSLNELIRLLESIGYRQDEYDPGCYVYSSTNMQAAWVNINDGNVGANLIDDNGLYETYEVYDLNDPEYCYDAYVDAFAYMQMIADPSAAQAVRIHHYSAEMFKLLDQVAPGRFDVPAIS